MRVQRLFILLALLIGLSNAAMAQQPTGAKQIARERQGSEKWALLVGVNDYLAATDLQFAVADVRAFSERLLAAGFPKDQVYLLTDGAARQRDLPFKANVETALDLLLGQLDAEGKRVTAGGLVQKGDLVLVAFSGHGVQLDGQSYLCPTDTNLEKPQSLVALDGIYKRLEACEADVKLLLVDACRNDPRPGGRKDFKAAAETQAFASALDSPPKGIAVLTSCAPGQISMEDEKFGHGVFMHYLLDGLSGTADADNGNRNNRVSLLELYAYASAKTKSHVADLHRLPQTPRLRGEIEGDWEFGGMISPPKPGETITNTVGMKLAYIPPGEFDMGSPASEPGRKDDETQHRVKLTRGFHLGVTEVTQGQWTAVMGTQPWKDKKNVKEAANYPATYVSWDDTQEFVKKLSVKEGQTYRLPTEAEWEYACRAGTQTAYSFGNDASRLSDYGWWGGLLGDGNAKTEQYAHEVAQKKANAFGLYDMHGNVYEWCGDWHGDYAGSAVDPVGASSGTLRVLRGGSWINLPEFARASFRFRSTPGLRLSYLGFRVVLSPETP